MVSNFTSRFVSTYVLRPTTYGTRPPSLPPNRFPKYTTVNYGVGPGSKVKYSTQ